MVPWRLGKQLLANTANTVVAGEDEVALPFCVGAYTLDVFGFKGREVEDVVRGGRIEGLGTIRSPIRKTTMVPKNSTDYHLD